jgi:hypothetical protein
MSTLTSSEDFTHDAQVAKIYVAARHVDAAALLSEMQWGTALPGVLRCQIYGHSILWAITGEIWMGAEYEVLGKDEDDIWRGTLQQVLAYILARNW